MEELTLTLILTRDEVAAIQRALWNHRTRMHNQAGELAAGYLHNMAPLAQSEGDTAFNTWATVREQTAIEG